MAQTNVNATTLEKYLIIEKVLVSDIFVRLIYTIVPKFLAIMLTMVWILDSGATRHVSGDWSRFPDLIDDYDFCRNANGEQLTIKNKKNIDLSIEDKILRLLDGFYIPSITVNLISITRLWLSNISIFFPTGWTAEVSFNGIIFTYGDNMRDQFILR